MARYQETIKVRGEQLVRTFKQLLAAGNVRRITVKDVNGREIIEFPLSVGLVGAVLVPMVAAVAAVGTLLSECTISVTKEDHTVSH